jgi:predicted metal-dependent hydrolase
MIIDCITYGTTNIDFLIQYTDRKTLGITVHPDGLVVAKVPMNTTKTAITEKILKRASWILKQQRFFKSFENKMPKRRYISGESHFYLGRQYLLKVTKGKPNSVNFKGCNFEIICMERSKAGELMQDWYKERSKLKFAEIAEPIIKQFKKYGVEPTAIYTQTMTNR